MNEQTLIAQVLAGKTQAFAYLVSAHQDMAFTLALRIVKNREEAEEVAQDAFMKAYRALPSYRFESSFSTWLYRIVFHTALSALKKKHLPYSICENEEIDTADTSTASALELLESKDRKVLLEKAFYQIPTEAATLLTLFYLDEMSLKEMAEITGLSTNLIKTKLFRARKTLLKIIDKLQIKKEL
ncbi:MAG: sigma-70 family RNA polymerase sigma factor [Massilibacteroides sp.]|nr:sigma-70 family RNA polymerase sigma factor [Massilibacteroides sp.]